MKKTFLILLLAIFTLAAASLMVVQYVQMKRTVTVSDNLFNISVNNAMDDVIEQLNRLKVEDYIGQNDRYRLLKFKRVEELNDKMQEVIRENYSVFYDTNLVEMGVSLIDSVKLLPNAVVSAADSDAINRYNTMLSTRDKLLNSPEFYDQFVNDISEYVVDNIISSKSFNYEMLDSLISNKLMVNGVDIAPYVGIYDYSSRNFLYCNVKGQENRLLESPFKYSFHPNGMMSPNEYYIILQFPRSSLLLKENSTIYFVISFFLISLILILFLLSLRTIFKQEKLDVMKTDFINNMTHEIKTPIATIGLACEMLQDPTTVADTDSRMTYIGIIDDENKRMRMLIETILQNAKMSNSKYSIEKVPTDIHEVILGVAKSFKLKLDNCGGTLNCDLQAVSPVIQGDRLHITNMLYNLIDNAIKYSPNKPEVKVATRSTNDGIEITVSDKGLGISKEDQKHIFEKFYRVSTGDVHNVKGFGIGLNYVQQVVSLHGGTITVESALGEGSTFRILIR